MHLIMGYEETHKHSLRINKRNFFISEVRSKERWETKYDVQSQCSDGSPNSLQIVLKLRKDAPFHNFKVMANVERTDDGVDHQNGVLIFRFQNMEGKKSYVKYVLPCDLKGQEKTSKSFEIRHEHCKCLLREDDGLTFPGDVLIVRVKLMVLCPHGHNARSNLIESKQHPADEDNNKKVVRKEKGRHRKPGPSIRILRRKQ